MKAWVDNFGMWLVLLEYIQKVNVVSSLLLFLIGTYHYPHRASNAVSTHASSKLSIKIIHTLQRVDIWFDGGVEIPVGHKKLKSTTLFRDQYDGTSALLLGWFAYINL